MPFLRAEWNDLLLANYAVDPDFLRPYVPRGTALDLFEGYGQLLHEPASIVPGPVDPALLTPETIQACLDKHGGRQEPTWRELGLSSRYALGRLVRRHGLRVRGGRKPNEPS